MCMLIRMPCNRGFPLSNNMLCLDNDAHDGDHSLFASLAAVCSETRSTGRNTAYSVLGMAHNTNIIPTVRLSLIETHSLSINTLSHSLSLSPSTSRHRNQARVGTRSVDKPGRVTVRLLLPQMYGFSSLASSAATRRPSGSGALRERAKSSSQRCSRIWLARILWASSPAARARTSSSSAM